MADVIEIGRKHCLCGSEARVDAGLTCIHARTEPCTECVSLTMAKFAAQRRGMI